MIEFYQMIQQEKLTLNNPQIVPSFGRPRLYIE